MKMKDIKIHKKYTKIYENGMNMDGKTYKYMKSILKSMKMTRTWMERHKNV
jgi:hypothetical protein